MPTESGWTLLGLLPRRPGSKGGARTQFGQVHVRGAESSKRNLPAVALVTKPSEHTQAGSHGVIAWSPGSHTGQPCLGSSVQPQPRREGSWNLCSEWGSGDLRDPCQTTPHCSSVPLLWSNGLYPAQQPVNQTTEPWDLR